MAVMGVSERGGCGCCAECVFVHCSCEIAVVMSGAGCAGASDASPWQCLRTALHCACHDSRAHTDCCGPASYRALRASLAMMLLCSSKAVLTDSASMKSQRQKTPTEKRLLSLWLLPSFFGFFFSFFFPPLNTGKSFVQKALG